MIAVSPPARSWDRFWFPAVPAARLEWFRRLLYAYLWVDVWVTTGFVRAHGSVDTDLYQPLVIGRVLPLPVPTDRVVTATMWIVLAGALVGITGRVPRIAGAVTAVAYLEWMVIAFSYGKVDHDRFPIIAALFVVATVERARTSDRTASLAAGWALRMVQVSVVAVYFLSVVAKVRYGGWLWADSATLTQALVRRGTTIGRDLLDQPDLLVAAQWAAVCFEVSSLALLARGRARWVWWWGALVFHVTTYALLSIAFFPQLVCLLAFLPLERLTIPRSGGSSVAPSGARTHQNELEGVELS